MYFFLGAASITSIVAWYMSMPTFFTFAVAATIFIATYNHIAHEKEDIFMEQAIYCMSKTECCCMHKLWSDPRSVVWTTTGFKILSGAVGAIATVNTWGSSHVFVNGHYFIVTVVWVISVILWFISCIPIFICLIQCAAEEIKQKHPKPIQIGDKDNFQILRYGQELIVDGKTVSLVSGKDLIVRFRSCMAIQLTHDIVIGIFWMYLSLMLYDLSDDEDDSEWRTIFLSMMSWHIVYITLYHIYLKEIRSCVLVSRINKSRPCCAPSEADKWWSVAQLLGLASVYIGFIWRMREPTLTDLGCSEESLTLIIVGIIIYYLGMSSQKDSLFGTLPNLDSRPLLAASKRLETLPVNINF